MKTLCVFVLFLSGYSFIPSLTKKVIDQAFSSNGILCPLFLWNYNGGLALDSIWKASESFEEFDYRDALNEKLDNGLVNFYMPGYWTLHDISIPFWVPGLMTSPGDFLGLYPIAYENRMKINLMEKDKQYIEKTLQTYIMAYPRRLPDGTFSRATKGDWDINSKGIEAPFLWADDMWIGLTLLARSAILFRSLNATLAFSYANLAITQYLSFVTHLKLDNDLFVHGYDYNTNSHSCCAWGRANGWAMMSHIEMLEMIDNFNELSSKKSDVLKILQSHSKAISNLQDQNTGLFHQVLNETNTFLETSCTAMFVRVLITARQKDWLDSTFDNTIEKAAGGLLTRINTDGRIEGAAKGQGIRNSTHDYNSTNCYYCDPGSGAVGSMVYALTKIHEIGLFKDLPIRIEPSRQKVEL